MATKSLSRNRSTPRHRLTGLLPQKPVSEICLELADHSTIRRSAIDFFQLAGFRDPHTQAGRICSQFIAQNASLLKKLDASASQEYDGRDVLLRVDAGSAVGAIP
ncbi:MAG TPA: hypothetical protein VG168_08640, partial [Bryobacteraceae bacterium]|nr:hypothetical protein [Bryobacteraceae bacterium]